jgi:hypothetical protein
MSATRQSRFVVEPQSAPGFLAMVSDYDYSVVADVVVGAAAGRGSAP